MYAQAFGLDERTGDHTIPCATILCCPVDYDISSVCGLGRHPPASSAIPGFQMQLGVRSLRGNFYSFFYRRSDRVKMVIRHVPTGKSEGISRYQMTSVQVIQKPPEGRGPAPG